MRLRRTKLSLTSLLKKQRRDKVSHVKRLARKYKSPGAKVWQYRKAQEKATR